MKQARVWVALFFYVIKKSFSDKKTEIVLQLPEAQIAAIHKIGLPRTAVRGLKNISDYI